MNNQSNIKHLKFRQHYASGFTIVRISEFLKRESEELRKSQHRIDFYVILVITQGTGLHEIDFETIAYQKGDILFVNKGSVHNWKEPNSVEGYVILFTEEFMFKNQLKYNDLSYTYPYNNSLYQSKLSITKDFISFIDVLQILYNEYQNSLNAIGVDISQSLLRVFMLKTQLYSGAGLDSSKRYSDEVRLFTQLQKLLHQDISISRNAVYYCKKLNVSYQSLNEITKRLTKLTIKQFIDDYIIIEAKRHLSEKIKNVSEVSIIMGFEEVTNFSKF